YELLTGQRMFQPASWNVVDVLMAITEQEPQRPSTVVTRTQTGIEGLQSNPQIVGSNRQTNPEKLKKQLQGDLDNIVLMALRKEPQRRYASAEAFSEDIRRYLSGAPVQARKSTPGYRAGKFIRRHKISVAATAAFVLLLISFTVITIFQAQK